MRVSVLLFFFVFSPVVLKTGAIGSPEKDKRVIVSEEATPKTVKAEENCDSLSIAIETLSDWQVASGSYYDPKDPAQTKECCDGIGAFGRVIESGSVALGSIFTKLFLEVKDQIIILIEIKDLSNIVTPYGKGIFRLDDTMGGSFSSDENFFLDFHKKNLTKKMIRKGRFDVEFRIYKILKK